MLPTIVTIREDKPMDMVLIDFWSLFLKSERSYSSQNIMEGIKRREPKKHGKQNKMVPEKNRNIQLQRTLCLEFSDWYIQINVIKYFIHK